jgi:hypothetical protein
MTSQAHALSLAHTRTHARTLSQGMRYRHVRRFLRLTKCRISRGQCDIFRSPVPASLDCISLICQALPPWRPIVAGSLSECRTTFFAQLVRNIVCDTVPPDDYAEDAAHIEKPRNRARSPDRNGPLTTDRGRLGVAGGCFQVVEQKLPVRRWQPRFEGGT